MRRFYYQRLIPNFSNAYLLSVLFCNKLIFNTIDYNIRADQPYLSYFLKFNFLITHCQGFITKPKYEKNKSYLVFIQPEQPKTPEIGNFYFGSSKKAQL